MDKREKRSYSKELKERVLTAYSGGKESVSKIAIRFQVNKFTVHSWVYQKSSRSLSRKKVKFAPSAPKTMEKQTLSPEKLQARIRELERELASEKMRSQCLDKMIEIAERNLKIEIRKKSGVKQSTR